MCSEGFDQQIDANKALADQAISRLPAINATIQQAVGKNVQTQGILNSVAGDYEQALNTVKELSGALQEFKVCLLAHEPSKLMDSAIVCTRVSIPSQNSAL